MFEIIPGAFDKIPPKERQIAVMTRRLTVWMLVVVLASSSALQAMPVLVKEALNAWNVYIDLAEKRMDEELKAATVPLRTNLTYLKTGKIEIRRLETPGPKVKSVEIPHGTIHHWMGAIFIPEMTLDKLVPWLQNYSDYQHYFKDLDDSNIRSRNGQEFDIFLRMKRSKLGVTAHFNTKHHVVYGAKRGGFLSSVSRSTEIRQVKNAGTPQESEYPVGDDSGYMWRLNSYWRFTERDGGVVVECESIALSRSLGWGLGLLNIFTLGRVRGIAESIAREALEETLTGLRNGVRGGPRKTA